MPVSDVFTVFVSYAVSGKVCFSEKNPILLRPDYGLTLNRPVRRAELELFKISVAIISDVLA